MSWLARSLFIGVAAILSLMVACSAVVELSNRHGAPIGIACPQNLQPLQAALAQGISARPAKFTPLFNAVLEPTGNAEEVRLRAMKAGAACRRAGVPDLQNMKYECSVELTCRQTAPYFRSSDRTYRAAFDLNGAGVTALTVRSNGGSSLDAHEGPFVDKP